MTSDEARDLLMAVKYRQATRIVEEEIGRAMSHLRTNLQDTLPEIRNAIKALHEQLQQATDAVEQFAQRVGLAGSTLEQLRGQGVQGIDVVPAPGYTTAPTPLPGGPFLVPYRQGP